MSKKLTLEEKAMKFERAFLKARKKSKWNGAHVKVQSGEAYKRKSVSISDGVDKVYVMITKAKLKEILIVFPKIPQE